MATKSEIKFYSSLKQKKYRKLEHKFLAEGKRLVEEGVNSRFVCDRIFMTNEFVNSNSVFIKDISKQNILIDIVSKNDFLKISSTKTPQGILAVFKIPKIKSNYDKTRNIVALENISDPGNLGTILRTCDWFGISNLLLSEDCAELYNPKVVRASMGAVFNLNVLDNIKLVDETKLLQQKNYQTFVADMDGENYKNVKWQKKSIITFGNEANGPSKELKQISQKITIPQKGKVESLNVAAAAAVIISEVQNFNLSPLEK